MALKYWNMSCAYMTIPIIFCCHRERVTK